jgi:hypothetical protein
VGATFDKLPQPHSRIYGIAIDQEALAYTQMLNVYFKQVIVSVCSLQPFLCSIQGELFRSYVTDISTLAGTYIVSGS